MITPAKLIIFLLLLSTSALASFSLPELRWKNLSENERASVLSVLRDHLGELEKLSPEEVAGFRYGLFQEAYAAGFDCFVAGWPTTRSSKGSCQSPTVHNASYGNYLGCREGQLLCNPTLFGDGLCIKFKTSTEKNSAFAQCEKEYAKEGRLFSEVLEASSPQEFDELVATVYQSCHVKKDSTSRSSMCQKLKRKLQHFVPDETPQNYETAKAKLKDSDPEKILKAATTLQSEMEGDYNEFKRVCGSSISSENQIYCKNLALRVKKSNELLPKLFQAVENKVNSSDCVNCSSKKQNDVLNSSALPELSSSKKLTCSEDQKKSNLKKCDQEVFCAIGSTVFSSAVVIAEALGQKPNSCISSQNDCVTNLVSALVDSILSLVTGIWDLLGMLVEWTGGKLSEFWNYVRGVEDKTSDAQHLLNKMSDADKKEVKTNPIKWVTNLAQNIWGGIKTWMKEDIFCEKWSGVPRASQCVQPAVSFDCLSCRTMMMGTCSAGGVILAEVLPAFFTGGAVNVVARGASGAKAFANVIKGSKAYKKVAKAVDNLSDIRAIKLASEGAKTTGIIVKNVAKPTYTAVKSSLSKVSSGYKSFVTSTGFKTTSKVLDQAAKYSGLKYMNKVMDEAYDYGYKFVDDISGAPKNKSSVIALKLEKAKLTDEEVRAAVEPLYKNVNDAYTKGFELNELQDDLRRLKFNEVLSDQTKLEITESINQNIAKIKEEIAAINSKFVHDLHELYKKEGIHTNIVNNQGSFGLELDFTKAPTTNFAFEFYKRARSRFGIDRVTVNLEESSLHSALGFFQPQLKRMEIGPNQGLQLLEEYVNSTGKHELRHSMFLAKRNRGEDSIFHLQFHASPGGKNLLNEHRMYDAYMSAEELYTFSTDLHTYAKVFKGEMVTDLKQRQSILNQIYGHNESLKIVSNASRELAESMLETTGEILNKKNFSNYGISQDGKGNFLLTFKDKLDRTSSMTFVSVEEHLLMGGPQVVMSKFVTQQETYLVSSLKSKGIDIDDLMKRAQIGQMTKDEKEIISELMKAFDKTPEAIAIKNELNLAILPAVKKANDEFLVLKKLAETQLDETRVTTDLIKSYAQGGKEEQLIQLKNQLVKVGKNVKEDYKGFAGK